MHRNAGHIHRHLLLLGAAFAFACDRGPVTWETAGTVVYENCAGCHRDGGPAPFTLLSWDEAAPRAALIDQVLREGRMPPWLPADRGVAFQGDRRLTEREKETLLRWVADGALQGDPDDAPPSPQWPTGWALGEPDLVLDMDESYEVYASGPDQFRNFVLSTPVDRPRWIRAVELKPSNPRVVHHATMRVDPTASSRIEDARDSVPGFDEMFSRTDARPPGGFFLGWTPGRMPRENPPGMAWTLEPGTDFIVQLHLRATGRPEVVSAQVGLWFTDEPPEVSPMIVRLGGETIDIPAGDSAYVVEDAFTLPVDVQAIGVYPHAHYLATEMEVWADLPDGSERSIISIPRWDFMWQDAYRYVDPLELPAGSVLRMRYVFDNSAGNPMNPSDPPHRVVYGPASDDEMAELWLQVITADPDDLAELGRAMALEDRADKEAGWRFLVSVDPTDALAQFGLGTRAQEEGDLVEAERRYRLAIDAEPDFVQAHYNLGLLAEERGDLAGAEALYAEAVERVPEFAPAWNNYGRVLRQRDRVAEAHDAFERALEREDADPEILVNVGSSRRETGDVEGSADALRRAVDLAPADPRARFSYAVTLAELGRAEEALEQLNAGLQRDGGNVAAALEVAWVLATHPDPARRRGEIAAGLAAQIREATGPRARVLDVEAAGLAATGRFDLAVPMAEQAVAAAENESSPDLAEIRARLAAYRSGRPWVR